MISEKSIQEVFNIAAIQDIVDDYVNLKRRGSNLIGLCPFHDEKTPSFSVSPSKNIFKCFGCGKGGGPVQFLMEHDHLSFPEAVRKLASKYNIILEEDKNFDKEKYQEEQKLQESYYLINSFAADYFSEQLLESADGRAIGLSYYKERGFLESTIKKFQLGYTNKIRDSFKKVALKKQYQESYLKELGLLGKSGSDFFRDRVMFPIHEVSGKVVAFAGRTLSSDKNQPKYINSPETPIYNKSRTLYGLHLAKTAIRKEDVCFIVEGYTDVISLHQSGIENVTASSGTALTTGQVRLVKRYTENITFLYDGDTAGIKAALRGLDIVLENDMNVKVVILPDGHDPDTYIKAVGSAEFRSYVEAEAKDFIFFKMSLLQKEAASDPVKQSQLIKDVMASIAKLRDPIKRSVYIKQCGRIFEVQESVLIKEVNKMIRQEIKKKDLEKQRAERLNLPKGDSPDHTRDIPFPQELGGGDYHPMDEWPEEKIKHSQPSFKKKSHEYQEKDIARIVVAAGDKIIQTEDEKKMTVADLIYSGIAEVFEFFDNPLYQRVIKEGFNFVESSDGNISITQFFTNHTDRELAQFAVDALTSPYEFANWEGIGVFLNQKYPEKNYYDDSLQSILRFNYKKISKVILKVKKQIAEPENTPERKLMLLKAFQKLQNQKKILAERLGVVISAD